MAKPAAIDGLAPETPFGTAARRSLAVRLAEVRAFEPRLQVGRDADLVHDMRVATRRLRAALGLYDRKGALEEAKAEAKRLQDALGEVRDLDVQLEWLDGVLAPGLPDREAAGILALRERLQAALAEPEARLREAVARWSAHVAPRLERRFASVDGKGRLGGRRLRRKLRRKLRRVEARLERVLERDDPRTAHRLRIDAKRLRYAAELMAPGVPGPADGLLELLPPLQALLGDLHDCDVRIALVERALTGAHGADEPGLVRLLRDELARRRRLGAELAAGLRHLRIEGRLPALRAALA